MRRGSCARPPSVGKFAAGREGCGNVERFARRNREACVKQVREFEDCAKNQKPSGMAEKSRRSVSVSLADAMTLANQEAFIRKRPAPHQNRGQPERTDTRHAGLAKSSFNCSIFVFDFVAWPNSKLDQIEESF